MDENFSDRLISEKRMNFFNLVIFFCVGLGKEIFFWGGGVLKID